MRRGTTAGIAVLAGLAIGAPAAGAAVTTSPNADADTTITSPATPHGHAATLAVGPLSNAYVRFTVANVTRPVLRATLRLRVVDGTTGKITLGSVSPSWTEDSLTWLNAPRPPQEITSLTKLDTGTTATFDVSAAVKDDGTYAFVLRGAALDPAAFASRESGTAPQLVLQVATAAQNQLTRIVAAPATAARTAFGVRDNAQRSMDGLKVIANPAGTPRYLGVYHSDQAGVFHALVATSDDLISWTAGREFGDHASMPTIAALPGGGLLVAWEQDATEADGSRDGHVRIASWASAATLLSGADPVSTFDAPRTLSAFAGGFEGTPWVRAVDPDGTIHLGLHFLSSGTFVDRAAGATLTGFGGPAPAWTAARDDTLNTPVLAAGASANIGDADDVALGGVPLTLIEGQTTKNDFGSWAPYVVDPAGDGIAQRVDVATPAGSKSFGNPTISILPAPNGIGQVALVTLFVFGERSGPGEAGELVFYRAL